ncbi:hypothetical protein M2103_001636 [Ereboglobus sp. PH5-5]|nr:hypothetical protein [Ereboglobus sp. PH5-5]
MGITSLPLTFPANTKTACDIEVIRRFESENSVSTLSPRNGGGAWR